MNLELSAMRWLRFDRRCRVVLFERSPRQPFGARPDVIGVDDRRRLIEIEVKRSSQDFKKNAGKRHVINRDSIIVQWPYQYYFLVPYELKDEVLPLTPDWAGLMTLGGYQVTVVKKSPLNKESKRLSVKECLHLVALMANQICASETCRSERFSNFIHAYEPWGVEYFI